MTDNSLEVLEMLRFEDRYFRKYKVKEGDSLFQIAMYFNIPLENLIRVNPEIPNSNFIFPGQVIYIPPISTSRERIYRVNPGDTIFDIAQRYNISLDILIAANPHISYPDLIYPDDIICIPVSSEINYGEATKYTPISSGGYCKINSASEKYFVAALNRTDFNNCQLCGACVEVVGHAGSVKVLIIDRMETYQKGNIDLDPDAFNIVSGIDSGRVQVKDNGRFLFSWLGDFYRFVDN